MVVPPASISQHASVAVKISIYEETPFATQVALTGFSPTPHRLSASHAPTTAKLVTKWEGAQAAIQQLTSDLSTPILQGAIPCRGTSRAM